MKLIIILFFLFLSACTTDKHFASRTHNDLEIEHLALNYKYKSISFQQYLDGLNQLRIFFPPLTKDNCFWDGHRLIYLQHTAITSQTIREWNNKRYYENK